MRIHAEFKVLAALVLLLSDALVAVLVCGVFAVVVWMVLRALMGLYPGYGLSSAERLRRHTYSVVGTLAGVSFAIALKIGAIASKYGPFDLVGGGYSRLLLVLGFLGLFLLPPLVQALALWGMRRLGIWNSLVNDGLR